MKNAVLTVIFCLLAALGPSALYAGDPPTTWDKNINYIITKGECSGTITGIKVNHFRFKSESGQDYRLVFNTNSALNIPLFDMSVLKTLKDGDKVTVSWALSSEILVYAVKKSYSHDPSGGGNSRFEEEKRKKNDQLFELYQRGISYYNNENFEEALKIWQAIVVLDSSYKEVGKKGGYLDLTNQRITEKRAWKHINDGNELAAAGKIVEALAEWQSGIALSPENKTLNEAVQLSKQKILNEHNAKGSDLIKQGKVVEAIAEFNAALGIDPANETAKKGIEVTNSKFKNLREEEKISLEYESYYNRAMAAIDKKDYIAALDFYGKAAKVRPSKELQNGINTLNEQLKLMSNSAIDKAELCVKDGNWVEAAKQWRLCLSINPKGVKAEAALEKYSGELKAERDRLYLEGLEAYGKEDIDTAIAKWKDVLILDPEYQKAQLNILKATRKQ